MLAGTIDLSRDSSLLGTYTGVEPMGLMWSMVPHAQNKVIYADCTAVEVDATVNICFGSMNLNESNPVLDFPFAQKLVDKSATRSAVLNFYAVNRCS